MKNTSCLEDSTSLSNEYIDNENMKQVDEIVPLINETSFNFKNIVQPIVSYLNFLSKL